MEERLAAQWSGYTWEQYLVLPGADRWIDPENPSDSKAMVLATFRKYGQIESVRNDYPSPKNK